jgi:hypothetical protein
MLRESAFLKNVALISAIVNGFGLQVCCIALPPGHQPACTRRRCQAEATPDVVTVVPRVPPGSADQARRAVRVQRAAVPANRPRPPWPKEKPRVERTVQYVRGSSSPVRIRRVKRPGGRWTDPDGLPPEKFGYAMRDPDRLVATARRHGEGIGIYAERLLDDKQAMPARMFSPM